MEILTLQKKGNKNYNQVFSKIFFLFLLLLSTVTVGGEDFSSDVENIFAIERQKSFPLYVSKRIGILRTDPTSYAFEVALLKRGEKVIVLYHTSHKQTIGGVTDYWYYVKTSKGLIGWIFGYFLGKTSLKETEYRMDPKLVSNVIQGMWWEVNDRGATGFRSIKFIVSSDNVLEGEFVYQFQNSYKVKGKYKVNSRGIVILNKKTPIGKQLYVSEILNGFRLFARRDKRDIYFKKVYVEDMDSEQYE